MICHAYVLIESSWMNQCLKEIVCETCEMSTNCKYQMFVVIYWIIVGFILETNKYNTYKTVVFVLIMDCFTWTRFFNSFFTWIDQVLVRTNHHPVCLLLSMARIPKVSVYFAECSSYTKYIEKWMNTPYNLHQASYDD